MADGDKRFKLLVPLNKLPFKTKVLSAIIIWAVYKPSVTLTKDFRSPRSPLTDRNAALHKSLLIAMILTILHK